MYTSSVHFTNAPNAVKATFLDLRKRSKEIARALDRNQPVTLYYRGKAKGVIVPIPPKEKIVSARNHRAFGMWKNRADIKNIRAAISALRKTRHAL